MVAMARPHRESNPSHTVSQQVTISPELHPCELLT
jgi:hypothetical protein